MKIKTKTYIMKFVIESTGIANWFSIMVSPPQSSLSRSAIRTDRSFAFCCGLEKYKINVIIVFVSTQALTLRWLVSFLFLKIKFVEKSQLKKTRWSRRERKTGFRNNDLYFLCSKHCMTNFFLSQFNAPDKNYTT